MNERGPRPGGKRGVPAELLRRSCRWVDVINLQPLGTGGGGGVLVFRRMEGHDRRSVIGAVGLSRLDPSCPLCRVLATFQMPRRREWRSSSPFCAAISTRVSALPRAHPRSNQSQSEQLFRPCLWKVLIPCRCAGFMQRFALWIMGEKSSLPFYLSGAHAGGVMKE